MNKHIPGLHHVTAIAGDPQQNMDLCTGFLAPGAAILSPRGKGLDVTQKVKQS